MGDKHHKGSSKNKKILKEKMKMLLKALQMAKKNQKARRERQRKLAKEKAAKANIKTEKQVTFNLDSIKQQKLKKVEKDNDALVEKKSHEENSEVSRSS